MRVIFRKMSFCALINTSVNFKQLKNLRVFGFLLCPQTETPKNIRSNTDKYINPFLICVRLLHAMDQTIMGRVFETYGIAGLVWSRGYHGMRVKLVDWFLTSDMRNWRVTLTYRDRVQVRVTNPNLNLNPNLRPARKRNIYHSGSVTSLVSSPGRRVILE